LLTHAPIPHRSSIAARSAFGFQFARDIAGTGYPKSHIHANLRTLASDSDGDKF
jgi:hypothetical protein